jgi:hypothetical protein
LYKKIDTPEEIDGLYLYANKNLKNAIEDYSDDKGGSREVLIAELKSSLEKIGPDTVENEVKLFKNLVEATLEAIDVSEPPVDSDSGLDI